MTKVEFKIVAVLGAGTMGAGIAQVCAAAGSQVRLQDVTQDFVERGLARINSFLDKGVLKGKVTQAQKETILGNLKGTVDLNFAVKDADLVIEAVPEDLEMKRELFDLVAAMCGDKTVIASNTSSLSLAEIFKDTKGKDRCLGTHFFNPPPLMPLLEIVRTDATSPGTVERVVIYAKQLGKEPIVVKDSPGFASSRLGVALGLEAIRMVEDGVAEPEDIDKAMVLGYGHPMGPLRVSDLVGLDVRMAIADYLHGKLASPAFVVPKLMRDMVAKGHLGKKTGQGFYTWIEKQG